MKYVRSEKSFWIKPFSEYSPAPYILDLFHSIFLFELQPRNFYLFNILGPILGVIGSLTSKLWAQIQLQLFKSCLYLVISLQNTILPNFCSLEAIEAMHSKFLSETNVSNTKKVVFSFTDNEVTSRNYVVISDFSQISQNPVNLCNVKNINFADISNNFTNLMKAIYIDMKCNFFNSIFQVVN